MHILNLVTNAQAPFFEQQVDALGRHDVSTTTMGVGGTRQTTDNETSSRSVFDYGRFYARVLGHATGSYDVVHANYGLTAPMALAQPHRPVVLSFWGSDLLGNVGRLSRYCARQADAVIVMSPAMAEMVETDCHVIPHGVDLELFRPFSQRTARNVVGWDHDVTQVLFPYAAKRPAKDYPRADRVVDAVRSQFDGELVLRTLHDVDHARMPLYLNAADALLLTSKSEGSPNAVKEAMACNLPVVATDVGDVRERLDGVEVSYVCRDDEALQAGLLDVLARGEPSTGRSAVVSLGIDRMGERIRAVYDSVV